MRYTKEQLIFFLKELAKQKKRSPTAKDMQDSTYPSPGTYYRRFGSWNSALIKAELKINRRLKFERKELLENLKQIGKELGREPKASDLPKFKWAASYTTYRKNFGTWDSVVKEAGLGKAYSKDLKRFVKNSKK